MTATFLGFHVASRALEASQATINVTGNNIANVNTEGYTRQRVDINAITSSGVTQKYATRQISTGLGAEAVRTTQARDPFLDARYRSQNSEFSRYDTMVSGLSDLENIFDEAQTDGLQSELSSFLDNALQRLSESPTSSDIAQVTRTGAQKVTQIINMYATQIQAVRTQQVQDLKVVVDNDFNTIVKSIAKLNDDVRKEEIYGNTPNELYDQRNSLIDKLSGIANIKVSTSPDVISNDITVQKLRISLGDNPEISIVDNEKFSVLRSEDKSDGVEVSIIDTAGNDRENINSSFSDGSINGYLDIINGKGSFANIADPEENEARGIEYYEKTMDVFAAKFAEVFNKINKIDPDDPNEKPLFTNSKGETTDITAKDIQVSKEWLEDPSYISTTNNPDGTPGSADNVLRMISAMNGNQAFKDSEDSTTPFFEGSFNQYMSGLLGDVALDVDLNGKFSDTAELVLQNINGSRDSISGVSLNEEGTNLMAYQKCYSAAIRFFTVLDENVDAIINNMGRAGR